MVLNSDVLLFLLQIHYFTQHFNETFILLTDYEKELTSEH